jgi:hypothetical protein
LFFISFGNKFKSQTNQDWQVKYSDYIINNYTKLIKRLTSLFYSNACLKFVSFKTVRLLWRKLIPSVLLKIVLLFTSTSIVSLFPLISIASGGQAEAFQIAPIKKKPRYGEDFKGSLHQCILSVVVFLRIL